MADKLLLVDGSSLIHRAFFALPPLQNKKGINTGAVYGLCNMLLKLIGDVQPKWMVVAFDKSRTTFRTKMFSEYKAQRKPTPSELSEQFPIARELLEKMNISTLEIDDYEADDIIGTFAKHKAGEAEVIIVTGDKDEFQLIDDHVKVFYTKRGISDIQVYDEAEFKANYEGLTPLQIIDLKGLMGDVSDNIPGVPGVGPKTAMKLLLEYHSVEEVLNNIDKVAGKSLKEKLTNNREQALLSKSLATINTDVPISLDLGEYELKGIGTEAKSLMQELEFRNLWDRFAAVLGSENLGSGSFDLFGDVVTQEVNVYPEEQVTTKAAAASLFKEILLSKEQVCLKYELAGELPKFCINKLKLFFEQKIYCFEQETAVEDVWSAVDKWLGDKEQPKIVCDGKDLAKYCLAKGFELAGVAEDCALAAYLIEPGETSYTLANLAERYLVENAGGKVQDLFELNNIFQSILSERGLVELYRTIELPLMLVLAKVEFAGIKLDEANLARLTSEFGVKLEGLETLAYEQAGEKFNLKSPKQLGVLLFEKLGLPVIKKTKTGYSTDVSVLEQLEGQHPLIATILEHRQLSKLHSTYLEGLRPLINPITKRIHTHFQQTVTVTGRLSSTDPNLQNIPTRTEIGKQIRELFVPGEGYDLLMSCDYSQVELRILAHIAQDQLLLDSFYKGQDVHARTASEVFGIALDEVSHELRNKAKAVNFGIVYGISDFGLGKQLGITRNEAAKYIENYFERYTGVKAYMDNTIKEAKRVGYVTTLFGRRRYLPDINHSNFNLRSFAERTAINTPIQGTAADIIKLAMIKVQAALTEQKVRSRILLQVHDELVLEVCEEEKELVAGIVKNIMEQTIQLAIPLLAEVAWGKNWAATK